MKYCIVALKLSAFQIKQQIAYILLKHPVLLQHMIIKNNKGWS